MNPYFVHLHYKLQDYRINSEYMTHNPVGEGCWRRPGKRIQRFSTTNTKACCQPETVQL